MACSACTVPHCRYTKCPLQAHCTSSWDWHSKGQTGLLTWIPRCYGRNPSFLTTQKHPSPIEVKAWNILQGGQGIRRHRSWFTMKISYRCYWMSPCTGFHHSGFLIPSIGWLMPKYCSNCCTRKSFLQKLSSDPSGLSGSNGAWRYHLLLKRVTYRKLNCNG